MKRTFKGCRRAAARAGTAPVVIVAFAGAWAALAAGCRARDDPRFNPYRPAIGECTIMQAADLGADALGKALDNLDELQENMID